MPVIKTDPVQDRQIMRAGLAETDARIDHDAVARDPGGLGASHPRLKRVKDIEQHIAVMRIVLHRLGHALRMHQADRQPGFGHKSRQIRVEIEARDIVDQPRPCRHGSTRHPGLARIDRDRKPVPQRTDHRQDTGDFLSDGNLGRAGPGRTYSTSIPIASATLDWMESLVRK